MAAAVGWRHVTFVESDSEPGRQHEIKRSEKTGLLACGCTSYRFSRGTKTCKHIVAYEAHAAPIRHEKRRPDPVAAAVKVRGETFRFPVRRAISFGPVPGS